LFETAIGQCGIAWNERGIARILLPAEDDASTLAELLVTLPDAERSAPPIEVVRAIEAMTRLLAGEAVDLRFVTLDLERVSPFFRAIYEVARAIPPGEALTYGEVARRAGSPDAARAVGQAMGKNPFPIVVPCHRVLAANGKTGGFSAPGGVRQKLKMLEIERAKSGLTLSLFDR
jgi:methylated-DNA-[protein]-cysteine S-methyltransferase